MIDGNVPFYAKIWEKLAHYYALSNEPKMNCVRWPEPLKGDSKTQNDRFGYL